MVMDGIIPYAKLKEKAGVTEAPASASASGAVGSIATDGSYLYVCVDTDTWRRVALETWS